MGEVEGGKVGIITKVKVGTVKVNEVWINEET